MIDVEKTLTNLINPKYHNGIITRDSKLVDDLGFDSLDEVELIFDVEEAFNIVISDNEYWGLEPITIGKYVALIERESRD